MMWARIAPILRDLVTQLAFQDSDSLTVQTSEYSNQQHAFLDPATAVQIELRLTNVKTIAWGTNDVLNQDGTVTGTNGGMREYTLNVRCKGYEGEFSLWALEYAERIRTRLQHDETIAFLIANEINFFDYGPILNVEGKEDGQAVSIATMDLKAYSGYVDVDAPIQSTKLFASFQLTSKLGGYVNGQPPNFVENIPEA